MPNLKGFIILWILVLCGVCSCAPKIVYGAPKTDYFRLAARADAYGMTSPFTADGRLIEKFAPDTLYMWMKPEYLDNIIALATPRALLPTLDRPYYAYRTPVGSFGYGEVSVRMKLRAGVKFALIRHIHPSYPDYKEKLKMLQKKYDLTNTVFVSEIPIAGYHEYTFFSGKILHSLSVGTPEHLAEISGEAEWIFKHDRYQDFDLIFKVSPGGSGSGGENGEPANLTSPISFDYIVWSHEALASRVEQMKKLVAKNPRGVVVFSEGSTVERSRHFTTKLKFYWDH